MKYRSITVITTALLLVSLGYLEVHQSLTLPTQWQLITGGRTLNSFADYQFLDSRLPRLVMGLAVGGILGLVGSLMQQLTQNSLTSPMTLGSSSGAWFAIVLLGVLWPQASQTWTAMAAMTGAISAFILILLLTGLRNLTGLSVVISGMVVNLLLGALASAIILLHREYAQNIFLWGSGNLAQDGWRNWQWLWPKLSMVIPLLIFAPRILILLRLGQQGAAGRGLAVVPWFFILLCTGIWLVSASITAVGLIGFIGLITPNLARRIGARTPMAELLASALIGAFLLLVTDLLAQLASWYFQQLVPSGVTAALIGAPALIIFARKTLQAQDSLNLSFTFSKKRLNPWAISILSALCVAIIALNLCYQPAHHTLGWLSVYQWQIRWPRALSAISVGIALAIAGTILQRLVYNPLASPDLLGISSGATFSLIASSLIFGNAILSSHWQSALLGSGLVLILLLYLGKRHQYAPGSMILTGIALSATLQALVQFCLAKGGSEGQQIIQWLTGSTYRVTPSHSLWLALIVSLLSLIALGLTRWLSLLSIGRQFATSRGLNITTASLVLLTLVVLLCAFSTANLGPIAFIGLIAPHIASLLGARLPRSQMLLAALAGSTLLLWADGLGQVWIYPQQIAAGTLVSVIGAGYFLGLLLLNRFRHTHFI